MVLSFQVKPVFVLFSAESVFQTVCQINTKRLFWRKH